MVYDFINICVGTPSNEKDDIGQKTIEYLVRCKRVMQLLLSDSPSSLGLSPAVYFYSWTGKQQPVLFLVFAELMIEFEQKRKLPAFITIRQQLEEFLIKNRPLVSQVVRKFGTKSSGTANLAEFYKTVFALLEQHSSAAKVVEALIADPKYSYLQPAESQQYERKPGGKFSTQVKSGAAMRELLAIAPRCGICNGVVPVQAFSMDHKKRRSEMGEGHADNAQMTHPYCNSGYKESKTISAKR
jgi:hypothetical protein